MDIRFWLSMHPRNFDCGKVIRLQLFVSPYVCLFMLDDAKCQTYYTSCVSLLLDLCYAQLTAVKIGHPLTSIT